MRNDRASALRRAALLGMLAFAVGLTTSMLVDRACGVVAVAAAAAGVVVGLGAGDAFAADVCLASAGAYFAGLFAAAAWADALNLLPFALMFMAAFTGVFLVAAWVARLIRARNDRTEAG